MDAFLRKQNPAQAPRVLAVRSRASEATTWVTIV